MKHVKPLLFACAALVLLSGSEAVAQNTRTEKDLLGEKQIPNNAYYGVQTARALENFQVSGVTTKFYPDYVRAYAMVKMAAARGNADGAAQQSDHCEHRSASRLPTTAAVSSSSTTTHQRTSVHSVPPSPSAHRPRHPVPNT